MSVIIIMRQIHVLLLLIPCVFSARTRTIVPGYELVTTRNADTDSKKVLTLRGRECTFPFRQGGRIHHHCITTGSSAPWCSLTHNFDRDLQWGYCAPEVPQPNVFVHTSRRITDPCQANPCQNGGVCTLVPHRRSFECSCPESFTGRLCEHNKCYETLHLRYYDMGESWGRIHLRSVEQCTCMAGETHCEKVRYTVCRVNPCQNEGTCRMITSTGDEVCNCRHGYSGPHCSFESSSRCYNHRGRGYRGLVSTTVSGAHCLPWNSDLLHDELHLGTVVAASLRGLGEHNYCRNPDGDRTGPWCYILHHGAISWEHCDLQPCVMMSVSSSRRIIPPTYNLLPVGTSKPKPARKPTCGRKHKKRVSIARGRILGGNTALPGTHPWMAAIYIGKDDFCAGSLISSCWVVSAGHCFFRSPLKHHIRVVFGQQDFNVTGPNTRTFGVEKYIFPKQFSVFNPTLHDIVLIKLKKQDGRCVKKTPFIRPICLPDKDMRFPDGYCCSITGWGHMHEKAKEAKDAKQYSSLQEGGVRLVPHSTCTKPEVYGGHVTSGMLCAGTNSCVDACQGDSGGPLACARDDVSFLYGIISWGEGCGRSGKPGVYTKVVNYLDWIYSVVKRKRKTL